LIQDLGLVKYGQFRLSIALAFMLYAAVFIELLLQEMQGTLNDEKRPGNDEVCTGEIIHSSLANDERLLCKGRTAQLEFSPL
jgi:hypothetical protein